MSERDARRADDLVGEATHRAMALQGALQSAVRGLEGVMELLRGAFVPLEPGADQVRRIEEVARDSGEAMTRADLLALNFQVAAARLGDEDRHLHRVAHELRSLADRGARGAREIGGLSGALLGDMRRLQTAWVAGLEALELAVSELERAERAADAANEALSGAREAAARLAAAGEQPPGEPAAAADLAAAAEVRGDTLLRLGAALNEGLRRAAEAIEQQAQIAEAAAPRLEAEEQRLGQLEELARAADEIGRRARQLAINADLAATRSEDPGFGLFAEEARRLSEQAEATAEDAHRRFEEAAQEPEPARLLAADIAHQLRAVIEDLQGLAAHFAAAAPEAAVSDGFEQAWREDRRAAEALARARSAWREGKGKGPD